MEPDGKRNKKGTLDEEEVGHDLSISRHFFLPIWIRRTIQADNDLDGFLLDYGFNFLPYIGIIFWLVLLIK